MNFQQYIEEEAKDSGERYYITAEIPGITPGEVYVRIISWDNIDDFGYNPYPEEMSYDDRTIEGQMLQIVNKPATKIIQRYMYKYQKVTDVFKHGTVDEHLEDPTIRLKPRALYDIPIPFVFPKIKYKFFRYGKIPKQPTLPDSPHTYTPDEDDTKQFIKMKWQWSSNPNRNRSITDEEYKQEVVNLNQHTRDVYTSNVKDYYNKLEEYEEFKKLGYHEWQETYPDESYKASTNRGVTYINVNRDTDIIWRVYKHVLRKRGMQFNKKRTDFYQRLYIDMALQLPSHWLKMTKTRFSRSVIKLHNGTYTPTTPFSKWFIDNISTNKEPRDGSKRDEPSLNVIYRALPALEQLGYIEFKNKNTIETTEDPTIVFRLIKDVKDFDTDAATETIYGSFEDMF